MSAIMIKAMRISKPPLRTQSSAVACGVSGPEVAGAVSSAALTGALLMPAEFGNIYQGELFSCYIRILSTAQHSFSDVKTKVTLSCGTEQGQRELLPLIAVGELQAGQSLDYVVRHDLAELGKHVVECVVTYADREGQPQRVRKSWPFEVREPMKMSYHAVALQETSYVQVSIQNNMPIGVTMESVDFQASPSLVCESCGPSASEEEDAENDPDGADSFWRYKYLPPKAMLHLGYRLQPAMMSAPEKDPGYLGSLRVKWRTTMGARGQGTIPTIRHDSPKVQPEVEVKLLSVPSELYVGSPSTVLTRIINHAAAARKLRLDLIPEKMQGVLVNAISGKYLGEVPPKNSIELEVDLLPLKPGIQRVAGLKIVDIETFQHTEYESIGEVLVFKAQHSEPSEDNPFLDGFAAAPADV